MICLCKKIICMISTAGYLEQTVSRSKIEKVVNLITFQAYLYKLVSKG